MTTMVCMEPIEQVRRAVQMAKGRGYQLIRGDWGAVRSLNGDWTTLPIPQCCALGAYLVTFQPLCEEDDPDRAAAKALEVSTAWVDGFTHGWDGFLANSYDSDYSMGYCAGKILAEEVGL